MTDVLFIKTSSLGDVIHHMPALTEARARLPDARFAWVVEDAFAPLVRLHPAVEQVIPIYARDWRGSLHQPMTWREIRAFVRKLRERPYDTVIDTQGLLFKSALIGRLARGPRHGYDAKSIKEPMASWLYQVRHQVAWDRHAIERNRALTAQALGYKSEGPPDFGLDRRKLAKDGAAPYGVLLHATARSDKEWPEQNWRALVDALSANIDLVLPFGTDAERVRARRIAAGVPRARVPDHRPIDGIAKLVAGAAFVVGIDTGLLHLAAALGVPLVAIFTGSEPDLTRPMGSGPMAVLGARGIPPSVPEVIGALARIRA